AGELVSPPAGAIGRGDKFLLQIANRTGATVLSNDSFQEFHGEYGWLFDEGRLIGGKPVQGVGWIFTARTPVRGPKSRVAVRASKKAARPVEKKVPKVSPEARDAIAEATADAVSPKEGGNRRRRGRGRGPAEPVNEPLAFITFIADHQPGSEVEAVVDSFTSHGAFVTSNGARCYVPLTGLGDPPPRSAKDVLRRGEPRTFVVQALDPPRRGIELALPEVAKVAGAPTEETVEAETAEPAPSKKKAAKKKAPAKKKAASKKVAAAEPAPEPVLQPELLPEPEVALEAEEPAPGKRKAPAKKTAAKKKAAPAKKGAPAKKKVAAKKARAKKADVEPKKATKKKAAAKKAAAKKKAT
ncbi:MAG: hypothetical protein JO176_12410, partial [Acidimicrobiia bacterium]|nr:hypothetical protein [Acidimicrobiia bacterium]